jgi:hypothetical protein
MACATKSPTSSPTAPGGVVVRAEVLARMDPAHDASSACEKPWKLRTTLGRPGVVSEKSSR